MAYNRLKTIMLLVALTGALLWIGDVLGGQTGVLVGLFGVLLSFAAYRWSDSIVLRMHGAQEVSQADAPELLEIVRSLAGRARLPTLRVYVVPVPAPNAFATDRNVERAAVAVTDGAVTARHP